jgi:hypothetical protein
MGVDVHAVAGFCVNLPETVVEKLLEEDEDLENVLSELELEYEYVGNSYSEDIEPKLIFRPIECANLDAQLSNWLAKVNKALKTSFTVFDVFFLEDTYWS